MKSKAKITIAAVIGMLTTNAWAAEDYPAVSRQSTYVPVRDGTKLAMNVYRPVKADGQAVEQKLPVIFVFTPYRARYQEDGEIHEIAMTDALALRSLIRAGYVVAVADIRGKGASYGHRRGFQDRTEAEDGRELIQWLAKQPYTTGKVGMIGCSYLGGTTFHTASTIPPELKAVFIGATDFDKFDFVRRGGITAQFNTRPDEDPSVDLASIPVDNDNTGDMLRQAVAQHDQNTPMAGLWYGMENRDSVSAYTGNAFWEEVSIFRYAKAIRDADIATYFWSNWHDEPTGQSIISAANVGGKFLAGPGQHCVAPAGFDFTGEVVRYFDHHLKDADNGIDQEPRATYWLENGQGNGQGYYVRSDQLPGDTSATQSFYLSGNTGIDVTDVAQGGLSKRPEGSGSDTFTVNYDLPEAEYFNFWPTSMDGIGASYTSEAIEDPLKLIGYPVANITVSSDTPDTNLFVYLETVSPSGDVEVISFGRIKLANHKLAEAPYDNLGLPWHSGRSADVDEVAKDEKVSLAIAMAPVSRVLPEGTKLRFLIAGADTRQRNIDEIKKTPAPTIKLHRGWASGARIDLPVSQ